MAFMKKQFKIAACFFLLTVLLQGISKVDACQGEHDECSAELKCCDGYECIDNECEPEGCEHHVGNACDCGPDGRDCCKEDGLECTCDRTCSDCILKVGDVCNQGGCCREGTVCSTATNQCECGDVYICENCKSEGCTCDIGQCFTECCSGLACVNNGDGTGSCKST